MKISIVVLLFIYITIFLQVSVINAMHLFDQVERQKKTDTYMKKHSGIKYTPQKEKYPKYNMIRKKTDTIKDSTPEISPEINDIEFRTSENEKKPVHLSPRTDKKEYGKNRISIDSKTNLDEVGEIVRVSSNTNKGEHSKRSLTTNSLCWNIWRMIIGYIGPKDTYLNLQLANQYLYKKIQADGEFLYSILDLKSISAKNHHLLQIAVNNLQSIPQIQQFFQTFYYHQITDDKSQIWDDDTFQKMVLEPLYPEFVSSKIPTKYYSLIHSTFGKLGSFEKNFPSSLYLAPQKASSTSTFSFLKNTKYKQNATHLFSPAEWLIKELVTYDHYDKTKNYIQYHKNGPDKPTKSINIPAIPDFIYFEFDNESIHPLYKNTADFDLVAITNNQKQVVFFTNLYDKNTKITIRYSKHQNKWLLSEIGTWYELKDGRFYVLHKFETGSFLVTPESIFFAEPIVEVIPEDYKGKDFLEIKKIHWKLITPE